MSTKTIDLDQLLSWVRIGTAEQALEAEKEIGARFKKVSESRTKIFNDNVAQGVLLRNLQDFLDDLSLDSSQADDPRQWQADWNEWKGKYRRYTFKKNEERRAANAIGKNESSAEPVAATVQP